MPTFSELKTLLEQGFLGSSIASKFNGSVFSIYRNRDQETIIAFTTLDLVPKPDDTIAHIVTSLRDLGYFVNDNLGTVRDGSSLAVCAQGADDQYVMVVFTAPYPWRGLNANIRLSCTVFE